MQVRVALSMVEVGAEAPNHPRLAVCKDKVVGVQMVTRHKGIQYDLIILMI